MNANQLLDSIEDAKGKYIWEAQQHRCGEIPPKKRLTLRKTLLIAAVIALMMLLVGCAVVYVFHLQDLKIGEFSFTEPEHYGANWEKIEATELTRDMLSLQGPNSSPNQLATIEWMEFREHYDADGSLAAANNHNESGIPEEYWSTYFCYTWEMAEKLDAILEKYSLKSLGPALLIQRDQVPLLFDALQLPGICRSDAGAQIEYGSGYFYAGGSYRLSLDVTLTGADAVWPYPVFLSVRCSVKGYFDPVSITVSDIESYQQWNCTLSDGTPALIAWNGENALILADREDAFLSAVFETKRGIDSMSKEAVEQIAGVFDFSTRPHSLSEDELAGVQAQLDTLNQQALEVAQQWQVECEQSLYKEGFDGWVRQVLEESEYDPSDLGYAFLDIDGNGTEELLIGRDGYATAVYIQRDGVTELLSNAYLYQYPCQGNKLVGDMGWGIKEEYFCMDYSGGTGRTEYHIRRVPGFPEGEYQKYTVGVWNEYAAISQEEFEGILGSYIRIPLKFLPLSSYPLEEAVGPRAVDSNVTQEPYETYEEKIRTRLTDQEERWGRWAYDLRDLDGDGQEELIWREDNNYFVYTILNDQVCCYKMAGESITVCENGYVEAVYGYGPVNKTYRYYRIDGNHVTLVDYLRYDTDADPENPWFRSPDLSCQDITLISITQAEFDAVRAKYTPTELDMKPIADYPLERIG